MSPPEPEPAATTTAPPAYPQALHIRPTAELAERVLLAGDPGRALALAQALMQSPRMFNHHRGLWGYTGLALADGEPLTIQATGMGGPSAAIVLSELIALGARRAIRVGTCGALAPELRLGELVIAREAICRDGSSRALGAGERVAGNPALCGALAQAADGVRVGAVVSVDLFYEPDERQDGANGRVSSFKHSPTHDNDGGGHDALAIEMQTATLFAIGARERVPVGCVLAVSDAFHRNGPGPLTRTRTRIEDHALLAAAQRMGAVAVAALAA